MSMQLNKTNGSGHSNFTPQEMHTTIVNHFTANIDHNGTGAVIASPSQSAPDYYYHWVRDGAISMNVLTRIFQASFISKIQYQQCMQDYIAWVKQAQNQSDPNGIDIIGEPKYYLSGKVYDKPWGRPQNDSPALRAITLINYAKRISDPNSPIYNPDYRNYILDNLYAPSLSHTKPIKRDLEYVAHHWQDTNTFDPWEEVQGTHFFTLMAQRKALFEGAVIAKAFNDPNAAQYYISQGQLISNQLNAFWNAKANSIEESINVRNPKHKTFDGAKELDSAVLLGSLYGTLASDDIWAPYTDKVLATAEKLQQYCQSEYAINGKDTSAGFKGVLIGRYPNDTYNGVTTNGKGNPWFLTSNALAEIYYLTARRIKDQQTITINTINLGFFARIIPSLAKMKLPYTLNASDPRFNTLISGLIAQGEGILERIRYHSGNLHLSEQINRDTGDQQGANDLTWSYGTLLSAWLARTAVISY